MSRPSIIAALASYAKSPGTTPAQAEASYTAISIIAREAAATLAHKKAARR
jgi:hypothetical protein